MNAREPVLMSPAEVAYAFRVDAKTVTRWEQDGKLSCIRTVGGIRRYHRDEVRALLAGKPLTAVQIAAMWAAHWRSV